MVSSFSPAVAAAARATPQTLRELTTRRTSPVAAASISNNVGEDSVSANPEDRSDNAGTASVSTKPEARSDNARNISLASTRTSRERRGNLRDRNNRRALTRTTRVTYTKHGFKTTDTLLKLRIIRNKSLRIGTRDARGARVGHVEKLFDHRDLKRSAIHAGRHLRKGTVGWRTLSLILLKNIFFRACGLRKHLFLFHGALLGSPASTEITHRFETQPHSYPTASERCAGVAEFDQNHMKQSH